MSESTVETVELGPRQVTRRITVHAPASDIFALIVNPHRHHELDGSGTVRNSTVKGPVKLSTGDKFSVGMKQFGLPYSITSTATKVSDDSVVEWQHPMGHKWRWELTKLDHNSTEVTETFDYREAKSPKFLEVTGFDTKNGVGIEKTLQRLAHRFA